MSELTQKLALIQDLLDRNDLDALLLQRVSNFAWATCGASSYVNTATSIGAAMILITPSGRYLLTNNIEAPRLDQEENLKDQGWEFHISPWYESQDILSSLVGDLKLGADTFYPGAVDLSGQLTHLRSSLLPVEGQRFREVCRLCAQAMQATVDTLKPGLSEYELAAHLAYESESRGVQAIVNLIATDQRIFAFRHPLPSGKKLERYAMLVLCGRRWGLVCSLTRLVHFGRLPDELKLKAQAVARVDATFIAHTRPGRALGEVFRAATAVYRETGFPDEWHFHHQGGPAGYEPREYVVNPDSPEMIAAGQAYAWNPSITGTKSEDTILVGESGNEILTELDGWPTLSLSVDGQEILRPAILEVL